MKTNEIIAGLRRLCGQGTEYRRAVCRLAADAPETQQKRIAELEAELKDERHRHDRYVDFELAEAQELARIKAERRWIPVTERLPEDEGLVAVLVTGQYKNITFKQAYELAEYSPEGWILEAFPEWGIPGVTHWMPLPEPPKEDS